MRVKSFRRHLGTRSSLSEASQVTRAGVQYVDAEEAKQMASEDGFKIIDIRDASQYDRSHISKSIHVPLFIANEATDPGTLISLFPFPLTLMAYSNNILQNSFSWFEGT